MKNPTPTPDPGQTDDLIWALRNPDKVPADLLKQAQEYAADRIEAEQKQKTKQAGLFVSPTPDRQSACRYCGDDRTDKGSLICASGVFCDDNCYTLWYDAILTKRQEDGQQP